MKTLFDWIQVEVTSFCNAHCTYCPHTICKSKWQNRHMPLETFELLKPVFKHAQLIFLQGWGEPLLNPDFIRMIRLAKSTGCEVGVTTNGLLLDEETTVKLIESGIDIIALSLAGTTETNDKLRKGTTLQGVIDSIDLINRKKKELNTNNPKINIAYLLLNDLKHELANIPELLRNMDINEVVISTLDFVASEDLLRLSVNPQINANFNTLRDQLDEVVRKGAKNNLKIHYQIPSTIRHGIWCSENIDRALFVSADGNISPCVFTNLPVDNVSLYANQTRTKYKSMIFGNVNDSSLMSIWRFKEYRSFRDSFFNDNPQVGCLNCPKLKMEIK
ncbi:radical SAM protein [bacterium]|nr:radical SAM protein [bacterium]